MAVSTASIPPPAKLTEENGHLEAELETKMEWTEWGEAQKARIHKMGVLLCKCK